MRISLAFVFEHDELHRLLHLLVTGIVALHYRTRTRELPSGNTRSNSFIRPYYYFFRSMSTMKQKILNFFRAYWKCDACVHTATTFCIFILLCSTNV